MQKLNGKNKKKWWNVSLSIAQYFSSVKLMLLDSINIKWDIYHWILFY
jgi:hypothetical protein